MRKTQRDFLIGCGFLLLAAVIAILVPFQVRTTKNNLDFQPTFFPYFSCVLVAAMALILMISNIVKEKAGLFKDLIPNFKSSFSKETLTTAKNVILVFALCIIYYVLFNLIGFIIATAIMLPVLMLVMGWRKPIPMIIATALTIVLLYLFFAKVMLVRLP